MKLLESSSSAFDEIWMALQASSGWRHALYGPFNLRFYSAYHQSAFTDRSVVATSGGAPVAGLRVTTHRDAEGVTVLSCFGQPTIYVEARGIGVRSRREAYAAIKEYSTGLRMQLAPWRWEHAEHLHRGYLTAFARHLLASGGRPIPLTTQVLDLAQTEEALFRALTKSFRWSVNWGRKNLGLRVLDASSITLEDIDAFRALHADAAGRETRSLATWRAQYDMIVGCEAFACFGYLEGRLVAAALFPHSPEHCYYGVSASRRELFDKPLAHRLLWEAILHARALGCAWFEMGDIRFPYQVPAPSEKEMTISTFKRNFGGETMMRLRITAASSEG